MNDFELLERWRGGDQAAGDDLLKRHFTAIYRFFRSKLPDHAEDLAQRTMMSCVESRDRIDDRGSFKAYLFTIARRRLADHFRKRGSGSGPDLTLVSVMDLGASPSEVAVVGDEKRLLLAAMRQIPLDFQITLELFYWEDMSIPEVAEVLGIAPGTVKSRLSRARERLKEAIEAVEASAEVREATLSNIEAWARQLRGSLEQTE